MQPAHPIALFINVVRVVCKIDCFTKLDLTMIKINWNTVIKVLKFIATVITSVAGTLAVQGCAPHLL